MLLKIIFIVAVIIFVISLIAIIQEHKEKRIEKFFKEHKYILPFRKNDE